MAPLNEKGAHPEDGVSDLTLISNIDERGINLTLSTRYKRDEIYTCAGTILIAVNPYKDLPIYGLDYVERYQKKHELVNREPHVYLLTESAFTSFQHKGVNQSVVISGESGAGKTETAKFVLNYLCSVTSNISTWVQHQIIEANTILEAFGNAKTVRNDNSSRFGKFMQVCFDAQVKISGCIIQDYLLELSRITVQSKGERNYHVFYQLLAAAQHDKELSNLWMLKSWNHYEYVNQSGCASINGVDDSKKFDGLRLALNVLQVTTEDTESIFSVVAGILWLGNLRFKDIDGEKCELLAEDEEIVAIIGKLLGLSSEEQFKLKEVLILRQINVRGNVTEIPLRLHEARENRHAMARVLYSRTFSWLLHHINRCTSPGENTNRFLGILDIFGFENFEQNSFEQLCINYTNEKLHRFFNHYVFALEQELYSTEEIQFSHIQFTDNSQCVELIEKPPLCILKLLSEQCHMPKGCDLSYITNLHAEFENHAYYIKGDDRRKWEEVFGIRHYAGAVMYNVSGFVDKNRDVHQEVFLDLLTNSQKALVREFTSLPNQESLTQSKAICGTNTVARGTNKAKPTKSDTFRIQLTQLVQSLQSTNPWYVRCIKPNTGKLANTFHEPMVLDQLRYLGMLDLIRIRREGYPVHIDFDSFISSYKCLCKGTHFPVGSGAKDIVHSILKYLKYPTDQWQVGKRKVFLRLQVYEPLESSRIYTLNRSAILLQSHWRRFVVRRCYLNKRNAALVLQHAFKGWQLRLKFIQRRRAAIVIQSHLRGMFAREVAMALREMRRVEEIEAKQRERDKIAAQEMEAAETLEEVSSISDQDNTGLQSQSSADESNSHTPIRPTKNDLHALSHFTVQLNSKFSAACSNNPLEDPLANAVADNVDLDNLFAFLSEVHADGGKNAMLEEIENQMTELASGFDEEIQLVSREREYLQSMEQTEEVSKDYEELPLPSPPPMLESPESSISDSLLPFGFPSLPEPTERPPPPPTVHQDEPIYEAIQPRFHAGFGESEKLQESETNPATLSDLWKPNRENREVRRKLRIARKLHELEEDIQSAANQANELHELIEYAEKNFNVHEYISEVNLGSTLKKNKKPGETITISKEEMVVFTKFNYIPTSHLVLYDHDSILVACDIFKDLCRYMKSEMKYEEEETFLNTVIGHGLERDDLRDELYVMCMRQSTNNPSPDMCEKIWILLAFCVVAFVPSKMLHKYVDSFIRKNSVLTSTRHYPFVYWCGERLRSSRIADRKMPPSSREVEAIRRLGSVVCRIYFLDGKSRALDISPLDTAGDIVQRISESLGLNANDGWALYQGPAHGRFSHIKAHEFVCDVLTAWETKQESSPSHHSGRSSVTTSGSGSTRGLKVVSPASTPENRFYFYRRLFRGSRELSEDPMEIALLYGQAVYSVVELDEFPINDKVSLQLAGLQLQVILGDPDSRKEETYDKLEVYLPHRVIAQKQREEWHQLLSHAHVQYGTGKSELIARVWYLSCVMHFPLYGVTQFSVTYRGYWAYGNKLILGVNCDGVALIKPDDKFVMYEYRYADIESILIDPSDDFLTLTLLQSLSDAHKCLVFETKEKEEIASLIVSYCPALSYWLTDLDRPKKKLKPVTSEDRLRRFQNVINCRKLLVDSGILRKPIDDMGRFLRSTLRRLNKTKIDKLRAISSSSCGENYKGFSHAEWAFTRYPLAQSLIKFTELDDKAAVDNFRLVLSYSGLLQPEDGHPGSEEELIPLAQTLLERSMKKECLFNELFLQLIKQTTDHPEANSRVNLRHWALLTLMCSIALPHDKIIRKYLIAHLKLCSADVTSEEGKFARFAEKCLYKTMNSRRRQWSPSSQEILCTVSRRLIYARIYLMDGAFHAVEFEPTATANDVIEIIKSRIGLRSTSQGFALYEVLGDVERSMVSDEKLTDVMGKWERYSRNSGAQQHPQQHHAFLFKKHLFLDQYINLGDPVEKELLYFQMLHSIRVDRFPVTEMEAIMICSLRAQIELGDYCPSPQLNYGAVIQHCLPPRILPLIGTEVVALHHQSLFGMTPQEAKQAFFNIIQSWPLHKATFYDVMQSFTSNWPKALWLAIDQRGLHLLEHRTRHILCNYDYSTLISVSPTLNCLMVITGTDSKPSKVILNTHQAFQIANLVREYCDVLQVTTGISHSASLMA
ncbi:myosin-I heavy chain-like isoform X4 [Daphnia pulex]|uniref:myosin-I heavy chain-like isoform X4 n=1 Tax=Daphnia pulex TaxID=6669 RepID=UPI001EDD461E|nr:myosin-I heavy chain-like isoform X4 [Daphnia pulex]